MPENRRETEKEKNVKFRKGESGNSGGRPRVLGELQELARQHAPKAIVELARLSGLECPVWPSRHFAATRRFGRFRIGADIGLQAGPAGSVENDPEPTCSRVFRCTGTDESGPVEGSIKRRRGCRMIAATF
jgi:hypothetical protein